MNDVMVPGGVAGTPMFMVNDVLVSADPSWTVDDWRKVIDPLLGLEQSSLFFAQVNHQSLSSCYNIPLSTVLMPYGPPPLYC